MTLNTNSYLDLLFAEAKSAMQRSYSPYSHFPVGASLRTIENKIFSGTNIENAAYGLTLCAEASAIAAMVGQGYHKIIEMVVIGRETIINGECHLCSPCGACRQRIREFATKDTLIHFANPEGIQKTWKFSDLLPASFGPEHLRETSS